MRLYSVYTVEAWLSVLSLLKGSRLGTVEGSGRERAHLPFW